MLMLVTLFIGATGLTECILHLHKRPYYQSQIDLFHVLAGNNY